MSKLSKPMRSLRIEARTGREHQPPGGAAGQVFDERCGQCHRVAGVSDGNRAPDLSDWRPARRWVPG